MIELAPNWKRSLALANPLMLAGGLSTNATNIGAFVTLPLTPRARPGASFPRVVEIPGGVLMRTSAANPGLAKVLREQQRAWAQSKFPIIVAFASQAVNEWATMAQQLGANVGGIELQLNPVIDTASAIRAVRVITELPILAKLDLENAATSAIDCLNAGANALVIGRAPRVLRLIDNKKWFGRFYGPAAKPFALKTLGEIGDLRLEIPLVACGGIHSSDDVREFLAAGACAVQIDSAAWLEPGIAERIAQEWNGEQV